MPPDAVAATLATPSARRPVTAVARLLGIRAARSGALWGLAFGFYVAISAKGYESAYPDAASRHQFAASLGTNGGLAAVLGVARDIDTVAGFTAWRCLGVITLVGGIWGLLTGTRLRGEEDAGRWELLLAGPTTRRNAAVQGIAGLAAGWAALWCVIAILTLGAGRTVDPPFATGDAAFFSLTLTCSAAMFLAIGALASQLSPTRRQANGLGAAVLGAAFLLRVVADASASLGWLRWLTPLGWVEETHPMTGAQPVALLPVAALVLVCVVVAVHLAGRRDLGAGSLPSRDSAPPHTALLSAPVGLAFRLVRPVAIAWVAAAAASGLFFGLVAKSAADAAAGSSEVAKILERIGTSTLGAAAYLGVCFVILATVSALVAAGQVVAVRQEEGEGRLDNLLVRPVSRSSWLAGRLLASSVLLVAFGLAAGVFAWVGTETQGTGLGFGSVVEAGLCVVPPGLFMLGFGTLVQATVPRLTAVVTYGLVAWSFLLEMTGSLIDLNHWILDTSLLHHMTAAPAVAPDWVSAAWFVGLGLAAAALGAVAFDRRDLAST